MSRVKNTLDTTQEIINNNSGRARVKDYGGGDVVVEWGHNEKMHEKQLFKIDINGETAYINALDMMAVIRNV